jgi:hypothetical protein
MSYQFPDSGSPFSPEPEQKQRGCFFYGCIFASVLLGLILLLFGLASWATYRAANEFVRQYAEDAPAPIPVVEKPAAEVDAIKARIDKFFEDLAAGTATEPLALTADEINALIAAIDEIKGIAAVEFVGENIRAKVSMPLARLPFPIGTLFGGKFLNGTATIDARVVDGHPVVTLVALEAKGKRVPDAFLASLRGQNFAEDLDKNPDAAAAIGRLQSIAVKDGKLIFTPKRPGKPEEPAKEEKAEEPKKAEPAKTADPPKPPDEPSAPK